MFTSTLYPNKNKNTHYCHNKINELPGIIVFKMAANKDDCILEYRRVYYDYGMRYRVRITCFVKYCLKVVGHHLATILKNIRDRERHRDRQRDTHRHTKRQTVTERDRRTDRLAGR